MWQLFLFFLVFLASTFASESLIVDGDFERAPIVHWSWEREKTSEHSFPFCSTMVGSSHYCNDTIPLTGIEGHWCAWLNSLSYDRISQKFSLPVNSPSSLNSVELTFSSLTTTSEAQLEVLVDFDHVRCIRFSLHTPPWKKYSCRAFLLDTEHTIEFRASKLAPGDILIDNVKLSILEEFRRATTSHTTGTTANSGSGTTTNTTPDLWPYAENVIIILASFLGAFVLVLIIVVIACILVRRHRKENSKVTSIDIQPPLNLEMMPQEKETPFPSIQLVSSSESRRSGSATETLVPHISRDEMLFERNLSVNSTATVSKMVWRNATVAVKIFEKLDKEEKQELTDMMRAMINLSPHAHVVSFLAVNYDVPFIVMQYYARGSLLDCLRQGLYTTLPEQLRILSHIASGLLHLHKNYLVHSHMCAKNVLISSDLEGVISDVGCHPRRWSHSQVDDSVRWMAPEVLRGSEPSQPADVWAFGVTAWELMLGGATPYNELTLAEIPSRILGGYSLLLPPEKEYGALCVLVRQCFKDDPPHRPTLADICNILATMKGMLTQQTKREINPGARPVLPHKSLSTNQLLPHTHEPSRTKASTVSTVHANINHHGAQQGIARRQDLVQSVSGMRSEFYNVPASSSSSSPSSPTLGHTILQDYSNLPESNDIVMQFLPPELTQESDSSVTVREEYGNVPEDTQAHLPPSSPSVYTYSQTQVPLFVEISVREEYATVPEESSI